MAQKMTVLTVVGQEEYPGLAELNAAADAVVKRYGDLVDRIATAKETVRQGMAEREALLRKTVAGEAVPAEQTFEVETRIRSAEATAALLHEALPAVAEQVEEAERAVARPIRSAMRQRADLARVRKQEAEDAYKAAGDELAAAGRASYEAERMATLSGDILVMDQSPEGAGRRAAWAQIKKD